MRIYFGNSYPTKDSDIPTPTKKLYSHEVNSFQNFCNKYLKPLKKGIKEGSYVVIGKEFSQLKRGDEYQLNAHMFALDFDQCILSFEELRKVFSTLPYDFFLFTTHSHITNHVEKHKKWKNFYRAFIPCDLPSQKYLTPTVNAFLKELQNIDNRITAANESKTWSLPWFLPRRANPGDDFHKYAESHTGRKYIAVSPSMATKADTLKKSTATNTNTLNNNSIENQIKIIVRGLPNTGLHEKTRNFAYQMIMDGVAPTTVKWTLRGLMHSYDRTNPRQLENWNKVDALVDSIVKKINDWPEPELIPDPIDLVDEIKFPLHVLPPSFLQAAEELSKYSLRPIHDIVPNFIVTICMCIHRKAKNETGFKGLESFHNIGVINVAPSGDHKSSIYDNSVKGFENGLKKIKEKFLKEEDELEMERQLLETELKNVKKNLDSNRSDPTYYKKQAKKHAHIIKRINEIKNRRRPIGYADNSTPEATILNTFRSGGSVVYGADEGQGIFASLNDSYKVKSTGTSDFIIRALSGSLYNNSRISSGDFSFIPVANVLIFCQPDVYRSQYLFKKNIRTSGLSARILTIEWQPTDYENTEKNRDNAELDKSKMAEYWKRTEHLMLFDDRDSDFHYSTKDDYNKHMIRPVTRVIIDPNLIDDHIAIFNDNWKKYGKGRELEGKRDITNKIISIAHIMTSALYAYENYKTFYQVKEHTLDKRKIVIVKELIKYLTKKKIKEHEMHEAALKIKNAKRIGRLLTSDANYENALKGITNYKFSRICHFERKTTDINEVNLGLDLLAELNHIRTDEKERYVLNPKIEKNDIRYK